MKAIKSLTVTAIKMLLIVAILFAAAPAMAEVIVVVNKDVNVTSIGQDALSNIFLGKKSEWEKNFKIVPVVLKGGPVHDAFLQKYMGKTAAQFKSYWNKLLFTGAGIPPTAFQTDREIVEFVAKTKGAVGYIDSATPHEGVKVLKIQ